MHGLGDATCFQQVNLPTVYTGAGLTTSPRGWTLGSYTPSAGSGAIPLFSQASAELSHTGCETFDMPWYAPAWDAAIETALEFMTESTALIYQRVTASPAIDSVPAEDLILEGQLVETEFSALQSTPPRSPLLGSPFASGIDLQSLPPARALEPSKALQDIAAWSRLPADELAQLWNTSRRSIYNWMQGKPVRYESARSILAAHEALAPIAGTRNSYFLRRWLYAGDPSPAELIRRQRWNALQERVRSPDQTTEPR